MYRRRRRFGAPTKVGESQVVAKRRGKCKACGGYYEAGDTVIKLRIKKHYRAPCTTCGIKPVGSKKFHIGCVPLDKEKAMGLNIAPPPPPPRPPDPFQSVKVPPPPKPKTLEERQAEAFQSIVEVVKMKARTDPAVFVQIEPEFKTFQNITARALRPGTEAEGVTAAKMALIRALKLVF